MAKQKLFVSLPIKKLKFYNLNVIIFFVDDISVNKLIVCAKGMQNLFVAYEKIPEIHLFRKKGSDATTPSYSHSFKQ